jgi:hypothetical protein
MLLLLEVGSTLSCWGSVNSVEEQEGEEEQEEERRNRLPAAAIHKFQGGSKNNLEPDLCFIIGK